MPAETTTTPRENLPNTYTDIEAREIDFVNRFNLNWDALRKILGIMRPIRKTPGTTLVSVKAKTTLANGKVPEGAVIPYSKTNFAVVKMGDIEVEKHAKAVTIEEVNKYGAALAIEKSDNSFLVELQNLVLTNFYTFLKSGTLTSKESTWQRALAMAKGKVINKFNTMRMSVTDVVGFANVLDFYDYLGNAEISVQTQFGLTYVQNFMGYSTLILLSDPDIPRGMVVALPVENINLYYIDPGDSEYAKLGLVYRVQGETNLIGFHAQGNYSTAVGEMFALMGMTLWAEYIDGIAVVTVSDTQSVEA